MTDRVLILDFGSQVTQLIARRVRESGVYCEIFPFNADPARIEAFAPRAVMSTSEARSAPSGRRVAVIYCSAPYWYPYPPSESA